MKRILFLALIAIVCGVAAHAASPAEITSTAQFNKIVLASDRPVVVDLYADWCGPCRAFAPTFDRVADEFAGKASFFRVNIDKCPEIATGLGVSAIPDIAVLYVKDGELQVTHSIGAVDYGEFVLFIKRAIALDTRKKI